MDIKKLTSKLESTAIKQEEIARNIFAHNQQEFEWKFAEGIARKKLKLCGIPITLFQEDFPFLTNNNESYIIGIAPRELIQDNKKNKILQYSRKLQTKFNNFKTHKGIIQFLPYLMNGNTIRKTLSKELPIAFVNLHYDAKSLERRFNEYCK